MTPIGHSLTGAAIAVAALPPKSTRRLSLGLLATAVLAANGPDLPLPGWGHDRYHVSHSLFVGVGLLGAIAAAARLAPGLPAAIGGWRVIAALAAAWMSHYLLDTFYNHGRGLAMFWPLSDARLALPIPWFATAGGIPPPASWRTAGVLAIEAGCYGAVLAAVVWWRKTRISRGRDGLGANE